MTILGDTRASEQTLGSGLRSLVSVHRVQVRMLLLLPRMLIRL